MLIYVNIREDLHILQFILVITQRPTFSIKNIYGPKSLTQKVLHYANSNIIYILIEKNF